VQDYCLALDADELFISENSISVFPNPAINQFKVLSFKFKVEHIEVYDMLGQRLFSQPQISNLKPQSVSIDVSHFTSGIYFVKVMTEKFALMKKLVIER
jgi:hypothetical protein